MKTTGFSVYCFKMISFLCLLGLAALANAASYSNCDRNAPVQLILGSLPDPIRLVSGGKLPVKGSLVVKKPFGNTKLRVKVKIEKKILWGYLTIPCVSNLGSCTYDLDCAAVSRLCPRCQCPPPAGNHVIQQTIKIPTINVPSWLARGSYKVSFDARLASDNSRVACGTLKAGLSS